MFHLSLVELKARCRDAYCARTLTAQAPRKFGRRCVYYDAKTTRSCAIGCALPPEIRSKMRGYVDTFVNYSFLTQEVGCRAIQNAHDKWATAIGESDRAFLEAEFLRLIYS